MSVSRMVTRGARFPVHLNVNVVSAGATGAATGIGNLNVNFLQMLDGHKIFQLVIEPEG